MVEIPTVGYLNSRDTHNGTVPVYILTSPMLAPTSKIGEGTFTGSCRKHKIWQGRSQWGRAAGQKFGSPVPPPSLWIFIDAGQQKTPSLRGNHFDEVGIFRDIMALVPRENLVDAPFSLVRKWVSVPVRPHSTVLCNSVDERRCSSRLYGFLGQSGSVCK